jgi:hypothetical protein
VPKAVFTDGTLDFAGATFVLAFLDQNQRQLVAERLVLNFAANASDERKV